MQQRIKMFSEIFVKCIFLEDWLFAGSFQFWGVSVNHPLSLWRWRRRWRWWWSVHHTKRHCAWCWRGNNDLWWLQKWQRWSVCQPRDNVNLEEGKGMISWRCRLDISKLWEMENPEHLVHAWCGSLPFSYIKIGLTTCCQYNKCHRINMQRSKAKFFWEQKVS